MIKSKKIRRLVSVVLVLVLATQFVFAASATSGPGTVSWTDSDGYVWHAGVELTGEATRNVPVHSASVIHEGYWADGDTPFVSGEYTVSYSSNFNFPDEYETELYEAADQIDMKESFSARLWLEANGLAVPHEADYGSYSPTIKMFGSKGRYEVTVVRGATDVTEATGTIPFAPESCSRVMTGYTIY